MQTRLGRTMRLWVLAAMAALLHAWVLAAPIAAADEKKIQSVVQAQLDAFAADDAKRAFSYAAPSIRKMVGTADNFMAMVRQGYPAVYRPASVQFLKPESIDNEVVQRLQLTDGQGDHWIATYTMERQKDKSWRISGCTLAPQRGRMA